jgi:hypothetical protein
VTKDMIFRNYNIFTYFLRNASYHPTYKYFYKKDDDNGNFVSYIYSPNNLWFIYLMTDYNKVIKLIGEKLASQCWSINHYYTMKNKVTSQVNGCYLFVYITEKGKQILDMLENGEVKIGQLKTRALDSYVTKHKNTILDLLK